MEMYVLDLTGLAGREEEALARLTPQRRDKALRLRGEARLRSVGAGLLLRRYVGDGPFALGPAGKPYLPGGPEFSLSHSGALAVLAVSGEPVGADVELVAPLRPAVVSRVLTGEERAWLAGDGERRFAFLWTRKEAVLKCLGGGIDRPMTEFSVLPGAAPALDGLVLSLHTVEYRGSFLSAAARGAAAFSLTEVTPEELFPKEETI